MPAAAVVAVVAASAAGVAAGWRSQMRKMGRSLRPRQLWDPGSSASSARLVGSC